jgi:hypothetical protein
MIAASKSENIQLFAPLRDMPMMNRHETFNDLYSFQLDLLVRLSFSEMEVAPPVLTLGNTTTNWKNSQPNYECGIVNFL